MKRNPKETIADGLSLPRDVFFGDFIVTLTGNKELYIENYRGITAYDEEHICVQGKHINLHVCGCKLKIKYYSKEAMKIQGKIIKLEYE